MDKAKRYLLQAKEYLSHFKKVEKKGGLPKLKVTNKKTVNIAAVSYTHLTLPTICSV